MRYFYDPEYDRIVDESVPMHQHKYFSYKSYEDFVRENFREIRTVSDALGLEKILDKGGVSRIVGKDGLEVQNDCCPETRIIWIRQDEDCVDGWYEVYADAVLPRRCSNCDRRMSYGYPCYGLEVEDEDPTYAERCSKYRPRDLKAEREEREYTPCATFGDYSPSCPWNAPGMSIRDFI